MKDKPQSHKISNTFRFQGFQEKVRDIRVTSRDFILKKIVLDDEDETLLWQTILQWRELNLTLGFKQFQNDLGSDIQSVAQLLLNEAHVATTLQAHLNTEDVLALPPLLNSLVAFARDLPQIFYDKHFYSFVAQLKSLLKTHSHEVIENVFVCFVSLFTLLQKQLMNDIYKFYVEHEFCTLFSSKFPWYVNELAAQSLGNLIRKFPKKREIFIICLMRLKKNESEAKGVGRLFFQCLKSDVSRRLHSSASNSLSLLLEILNEEGIPLDPVGEAIEFTLKLLSAHVTSANVKIDGNWQETWKEDSKNIWSVIFEKINKLLNGSEKCKASGILKQVLQFSYTLVQYKHAALVIDFDGTLMNTIRVLEYTGCDEIGRIVVDIIAKLLTSPHYSSSSTTLNNVLIKLLGATVSPSVVFCFIKQVVNSPLFESDILPTFLEFIIVTLSRCNSETYEEILNCIVGILTEKVIIIRTASDLKSWSMYPLDFTYLLSKMKNNDPNKTPANMLEGILSQGLAGNISNCEIIILACMCLPHVTTIENQDFVPYLFWIINDSFEMIKSKTTKLIKDEPEKNKGKKRKRDSSCDIPELNLNVSLTTNEKTDKLLFLISSIVETLYHLISLEDFLSAFVSNELISILKENVQYRENVHLLRAIDIHLAAAAEEEGSEIICEETLKELYLVLAPSLSSPNPLVRLLVTHIFSLFPLKYALPPPKVGEQKNMFFIMFETESVAVSPLEYKERLRILSQLDVDQMKNNKPMLNIYDQAPVLFLIGQLYINFKEIWPTVIKSISKYAYFLDEEVFWTLWHSKIKEASHYTMKELCGKNADDQPLHLLNSSIEKLYTSQSQHPGYTHLNMRSNYLHFRDLLWQAMQYFPDICERRNRDVVSVFFNFLHNELFPVDYNVAPTQDISIHNEKVAEDTEIILESSSMTDIEEDDSSNPVPATEDEEIGINDRIHKAPTKSLCEHLALFSRFHNPKVIHKSQELQKIYMEFLSHPFLKAQKIALDALMTYNYKYLTPYRESLYNILDDKTFKNEITLFSIEGTGDDESKSLKEEHRANFMPILMRILYGKMQYKTGSHTAGKSKTTMRKAVVLRFLAGANESELDTFLDLSFDVLLCHLEGSALDIVNRVEQNLDTKNVVPLKRMQGALGTIDTIIDKIGSLSDNKKSFIFKVIIFILSTTVNLLENNCSLCSHYLPILKNLRQTAMQKLVMFVTNYEHYQWSSYEFEALFKAGVWSSLPRLPDEGIYTPTPLLCLFDCWAENPQYHALLAWHHPDNVNLTPMPFIMNLLNHHKCSKAVMNFIYNIIEKLIAKPEILDSDVEWENSAAFSHHILPVQEEARKQGVEDLSFGESILFWNLDDLLKNMKMILLSFKKGQMANSRDMNILMQAAKWVRNKETGQDLLDFIVPLINKDFVKQKDKITYLLDICCNLVKIVDKPDSYCKNFLCMFSVVNGRQARIALCQVIEAFCSLRQIAGKLSEWCFDLNAWSSRMVEEIDYDTRLNCYREVNQYLETCEFFEEDIVIFLIHHNFFVLHKVTDLGLKNLSTLCLQNLVGMLSKQTTNHLSKIKKIIELYMLPQIKIGIKSKAEGVRIASLNILCSAVHKCHTFIPRLKDLFVISDINDPDSDFLSNMSHIQQGRRTRALNKLADNLNDGTWRFQTDCITEFLLPITSVFLFKEEFVSDDNLLNSSVRCIGVLAKHLPWYPYKSLLKYYLNLLPRELNQLKLGIKVLEAVIDAFHEDISDIDVSVMECGKYKSRKNCEQTLNSSENCLEAEPDDVPNSSLPKSQKIYLSLTKNIIPEIQKTLAQRSKRDIEHKVNKKKYPEEEDIKRIPLALALIKLLKKLPKRLLDLNVNGVFMKLIVYLKSRADSIRRGAQNMIVKVMQEIGGEYLSCLIKDMNLVLTRGYQAHVMVFTVHSILAQLQPLLIPSHIDPCLSDIMDICIEDLFGEKAEEKEVAQLSRKVREVGIEKGFSIMGILAQIISVGHLETIMIPLKNVLQTHDKKIVIRVNSCLLKIANGIDRNTNISVEHKSVFIYGILTEKIKELSASKTNPDKDTAKPTERICKPDSFILEPEPRKVGFIPKISHKVTSHVLVEFALNLLNIMLKHDHFLPTDTQHCALLDSYVNIMSNSLLSEYPEVSIYALHVIGSLIKYPLQSLKESLPKICGQMFVILNKFASSGLTKGKLFELVQLTFKTIAQIIKEVSYYKLEEEHIKVLVYYARNNLEDHNQHHATFTVLNALIVRKTQIDEVHELMKILKELSVKSTNSNMLDQARRTYFNYMMNYHKTKRQYIQSLNFFLDNVSYPLPEGRMSAALMLGDFVSKYPRDLFVKDVEVDIWFKLTEQIIREDSKEQKLLLQKILRALYLKSERKGMLINYCLNLLEDTLGKSKAENALMINRGAQSLLTFLDAPAAEQPVIMFDTLLPKVISLLHPGRFQISMEDDEENQVQCLDAAFSSLLDLFTKLADIYMTKKNFSKWLNCVGNEIWEYMQDHLLYANLKIRLSSANLFGRLFAMYPVEKDAVPSIASSSEMVKSLILDFCEQLNTESPVETPMVAQLGISIVRNLLYLIRQGHKIPIKPFYRMPKATTISKENGADPGKYKGETNELHTSTAEDSGFTDSLIVNITEEDNSSPLLKGAYWVISKVGVIAYDELRKKGKATVFCREALLNLIAGIIVVLDKEFQTSIPIINFVMAHLTRELSDKHLPAALVSRTNEVADLVREKLKAGRYNEEMLRAQLSLEKKRNERRARDRERIVSNPRVAMQKKAKKHSAKKVAKKRKLNELKLRPNKKPRLRELAIVAS